MVANFVRILQNYISGIAEDGGRHYIILVRERSVVLFQTGGNFGLKMWLAARHRAFIGFGYL